MKNTQAQSGLPGLKRVRKQANISAIILARKLECSTGHIYNIERGLASPSMSFLRRLSQELNVSADDLLTA